MVGASLILVTVSVKAGRDALKVPSDTLITIPAVAPTSALAGVPLKAPVAVLKVAHVGLFAMLKLSVVPESTSAAVGTKL